MDSRLVFLSMDNARHDWFQVFTVITTNDRIVTEVTTEYRVIHRYMLALCSEMRKLQYRSSHDQRIETKFVTDNEAFPMIAFQLISIDKNLKFSNWQIS